MRLRQIEVFHAVYSSGSVSNAARILNVSQPSVSKVLSHAEQQLGYALFRRVKGRLHPTPEAHRLYEHVAQVYQKVDTLRQVSRNIQASDEGQVRIACAPAFGIDLLPGAISSYQREHSETRFYIETLHHEEMLDALLESRVDLALVFGHVVQPELLQEKLCRAQFMVVAPGDTTFRRKRQLSLKDLIDMPFIGLNNRGPLGELLNTHLDASGVALNRVAMAETYHVAKALAAHGTGIAIIDEVTARSRGYGNVRSWPLSPKLEFDICLLHLRRAPLSIVNRRFLNHMRGYMDRFLSNNTV